jgi:hypothetical protein
VQRRRAQTAVKAKRFRSLDSGTPLMAARGLPRFHNNQPMAIKTSKLIHYAAEASD